MEGVLTNSGKICPATACGSFEQRVQMCLAVTFRPTAPCTGTEMLDLGQKDRKLCITASYKICERGGAA